MTDYLIHQIELPLHYGFAPRRWAQALQTMLPKDPGILKIDRLRVIQLFEADYDFVLSLIWGHRLVWNAQKYMPAPQAQPGHLYIGAALNKVLSYDLIWKIKKIAATLDNDAARCYDNIVPPTLC